MNIPSSDELLKQIMITIDVAWRNGLELPTIEKWLDNFNGEALGNRSIERNLALWMLYNFTYFNQEEIKHLCKLILRKYLHQTLQTDIVSLEEINNILAKSIFMPLGRNSESGAYILYLFRQENNLPVVFFENDRKVDSDKVFVFIDDMTLSGNTAIREIRKIKYAGNKLKESDINDEFMVKLGEKNKDLMTQYISKILDCDKNSKAELAENINKRIIENKLFYNQCKNYFSPNTFSKCLSELIKYYDDESGDIEDIIIWKMNRLLLENFYNKEIEKGINNLEIQNWFLLSFIASKQAKDKLLDENIVLVNCIELDETAEAFSDTSMVFGAYEEEKELCKTMCEYYGKKLKPNYPLGYNNCQYLFGLYYAIPNNTLPIFWATENWNPLFIRHEKNYGGRIKDVFGKFI